MKYNKLRRILISINLFVAIGALFGSICMFIDPTGKLLKMDYMLSYFSVMPFSNILFNNYIFSGIALFIINGLSNIIAVYLILKNKKSGIILGSILGLTLMLWITIQFIILPLNILSISYFIIGLFQLIIGYITYVYYNQAQFNFELLKYKNINKNKDIIVVYFSRTGYTKKIAYEIADKLASDIIELKTSEKISGLLGFLWCGRYGMYKWKMKTENISVDLKNYDKVIIVSPIWVFNICSPIRDFCYKYSSDINKVEYVFTHFMKTKFLKVANETDKILNTKREKYTSICIRFGAIKNINTI